MPALIQLHISGLESFVRQTLQTASTHWFDPGVLADFLVGYRKFQLLDRLLEDSREAVEYVLAMPDVRSAFGLPVYMQAAIDQAKDMARAAQARHATLEALGDL